MTLDDVVCPHCGFRSEDEELCAACGRLFDENTPVRDVSILGLLGSGLRSFFKSIKPLGKEDFEVKEDLEFCPSWSFLSNNIHNKDHN